MCIVEAFRLQRRGPQSHRRTEQNLPEHCDHPIWRPTVHTKNGIITSDNHSVSLANIAVHNILQPIADVQNEAERFRRFIDDIIWISASEISNERIRQALT